MPAANRPCGAQPEISTRPAYQVFGQHGVHRAAEGLHDGADVLERVVGVLPGAARRHRGVFRQPAGDVAADHAQVLADVALVVAALAADAAENMGFDRDEVAFVEPFGQRADLHHLAAEFLAENERQGGGDEAGPGGIVDGQVPGLIEAAVTRISSSSLFITGTSMSR